MNARNIFSIECNAISDTQLESKEVEDIPSEFKEAESSSGNVSVDECNNDAEHVEIQISTSDATLQWLPTEMIEAILHYLSPADTISSSTTCQEWHRLLDNATIWRHYCRRNKWTPLGQLCEPCLLNADLDLNQFSLWKQCFLTYSRIRNNWMEGNKTFF